MSDVPVPVTQERDPMRPWAPSAFTRLARTHAASVSGDAIFTAAMAGTVFFSANSLDEAKGRVALTLLFTIAPFAVAAPLIGPLVDRTKGGRRWMIIVIAALRAVMCLLLVRHYDSWLLYPEGLLMLVLSKGHLIARGAIVPTVVRNDHELVTANAKLTLLSGIATAVAIVPAGILLTFGGPGWVLALGVVAFAACTVLAFDLPKTRVAAEPAGAEEKAELRGIGILLAASAMGLIRGIVGFLAFLIAFYAKDNDLPVLLGVGAVAGQAGFLTGAVAAPRLRQHLREERILTVCLALIMGTAVLMAFFLGAGASTAQIGFALGVMSMVVGLSSNVAKQAFDAIVQRDAPDANRGRSFARFETRFQLVWVIGALLPTALGLPLQGALVFIATVAGFALVSYLVGWHRAERGLDHRLIRIRRRTEGGAGDDDGDGDGFEALSSDGGLDDDRTVVMAVSGRRTRRRPSASNDATLVDPDGRPLVDALPAGLLGMGEDDPTLGLELSSATGLFSSSPEVRSTAPWATAAIELFDGAADLEADHAVTTLAGTDVDPRRGPGASGRASSSPTGLDVEPTWGAAAAGPPAPSTALPPPAGWVVGPVGLVGPPEPPEAGGGGPPAPPEADRHRRRPAVPSPSPGAVVAASTDPVTDAGPCSLGDEPRWRNVTTPHLPGFEPGVLEAGAAETATDADDVAPPAGN